MVRVSALVDRTEFPSVWTMLDEQVEPWFVCLRMLLLLPSGTELKGGCNLAVASTLLSLVSGFSVCLYDASIDSLTKRGNRGARFRHLLRDCYPWGAEDVSPTEGAKWLYQVQRNPLVHSLGVQADAIPAWSGIANRQLDGAAIEALERSSRRPDWLPPLFMKLNVPASTEGTYLSIPTLYWGTWQILSKLCRDSSQMEKAEGLAKKLQLHPSFTATLPQ